MAQLEVNIAGLKLKNPVMPASGTFGYAREFEGFYDLSALGAVIVKSVSLKPKKGNPGPRVYETPSGMLNAIGLQNEGVDAFIKEKLPYLKKLDTVIIANITGNTVEEFREITEILEPHNEISGYEVNISCPNVKEGGMAFGTSEKGTCEVVKAVKAKTRKPVVAKLTPNVTDVVSIAKAAEDGGADALSLINTLLGMAVNIEKKRPILGNITGGLSGPAIKPIALRMVWQVVNAVKLPVIGIGGVTTYKDALEYLLVGAKAVQIGTANFINPRACIDVIEGINRFLDERNIKDINDFIGTLNTDKAENCSS